MILGHARQMMTPRVISVGPDAKLGEISRRLAESGLGGLPVVDDERALIGFVSEIDVMRALLDGGGFDLEARALMTTPAVTVDEFAPTEDVMRILREQATHYLPVTRAGQLVGVITSSDVVRYLVRAYGLAPLIG